MKYAGIIKNDITAAPGVCVSFFVQGCPNHCKGCHNPESWDFNAGKEFTGEVLETIINAISANGITRPLCIMGGEPLCEENTFLTSLVIREVRNNYPYLPIYIWTGYTYEKLISSSDPHLKYCLENSNWLIDGPFILEERDITLKMRGSRNQRIINLKTGEMVNETY